MECFLGQRNGPLVIQFGMRSLPVLFLSLAIILHAEEPIIRAGMVGLDTSHATAFTKTLNAADAKGPLAKVKVVAALPQGSPDLAGNAAKVEKYTKELREMGVEIVDSMEALLAKCDVLLVESVDGRRHLRQAAPALKAGKRVFVDKPMGGTLAQAIALSKYAEKTGTPMFSASSLRFGPGISSHRIEHPKLGKVIGCDAWSPAPNEPHHPDLFWYGIHGVETLFTIMGPGIESVQRTKAEGVDLVVGTWKDGRVGTFRGLRGKSKRGYGATVFGTKGTGQAGGFEGYSHLVVKIAAFFDGGEAPVAMAETLEIHAFMEAADESVRQGGAAVKVSEVMAKAESEATTILKSME